MSILVISGFCLTGNVYANFGDAVVGGLVGGAVGSVITNEVYNSRRSHTTHTNVHTDQAKKNTILLLPK